jgi:hypothetical protein
MLLRGPPTALRVGLDDRDKDALPKAPQTGFRAELHAAGTSARSSSGQS